MARFTYVESKVTWKVGAVEEMIGGGTRCHPPTLNVVSSRNSTKSKSLHVSFELTTPAKTVSGNPTTHSLSLFHADGMF